MKGVSAAIPLSNPGEIKGALYINGLQKREKKTSFSANPNVVSRREGILGEGHRPLYENCGKYLYGHSPGDFFFFLFMQKNRKKRNHDY
jgi:hypothetical protein